MSQFAPDAPAIALNVLASGSLNHTSSFFELLQNHAPHALAGLSSAQLHPGMSLEKHSIDGTTVLAVVFAGGVVIAGDRRATSGHLISRSDMRKVFPADQYSAVAISGAAGPATDLAKLFATELEHYEKVEGHTLSLDGRATKLAAMVRAHLPLTMQGLIVVPLFAGFDPASETARIYEYDPVGGKYLATTYAATGSGSLIAKGTLKRMHRATVDERQAIKTALDALVDAAEADSATGGPDQLRAIYPLIAVIDGDGYREYEDAAVAALVDDVFSARTQ
jgi:proteasome beta subunit